MTVHAWYLPLNARIGHDKKKTNKNKDALCTYNYDMHLQA